MQVVGELAGRRERVGVILAGPYGHLTTVDIEPAGDHTNVFMAVDPLHDETWTRQHGAHRGDEVDNLRGSVQATHNVTVERKSTMDYDHGVGLSRPTPCGVGQAPVGVGQPRMSW